jgi:hypothetical protein
MKLDEVNELLVVPEWGLEAVVYVPSSSICLLPMFRLRYESTHRVSREPSKGVKVFESKFSP